MRRLISFQNQPRQLIIIDEQISQVNDHEFTALNAGTLRSKIQTLLDSDLEISNEDRQGLEDEKLFLEEVRDLIKQSDATTANGVMLSLKEQSLLYRDVGQFKYFSEYAKGGDRSFLAKVDEGVAFDVIKKLTNTLKAIQSQEISYARSSGGEVYINSLEWLNIHDHHAVVLDATASVDYIYSLHDDVSIQQIPEGLRQYDNVSLHVSEQVYKLGKKQLQELEPATLFNSLASLIEQVCPQPPDPILDGNLFDINTTDGTSREEVLIILPKAVREKVEKHYESSLHDYLELHHVDLHFAHWGNITGKNDYRHCSKVIIASLPFKPANHITNLHITSKRGLTAIRKHNDETLPNEIEEERTKIDYGTMAAEVIQAINRVRCRSVINEQGQCQETDIYLFKTHNGGLHESLISAITNNMKGIRVRELSTLKLPDACLYGGTNKRGPKTDTNDKLFIKLMSEQPAKRYSLKEMKDITGMGDHAIKRILDDIEKHSTDDYNEDDPLHQFCDSYAVKIEPRGNRGRVLVKGL